MLQNLVVGAKPQGLQEQIIKTDELASDWNISFDEEKWCMHRAGVKPDNPVKGFQALFAKAGLSQVFGPWKLMSHTLYPRQNVAH